MFFLYYIFEILKNKWAWVCAQSGTNRIHFDYAWLQTEFKLYYWRKVLVNEDFSRICYWTENISLTDFIHL